MSRDGLTHLDPPEHHAHKQLVAPLFAPRAIAGMESRVRTIAREVLDRACNLRVFDFANDVALQFPVAIVLGEMLGIPQQDFAKVNPLE
jgi:cytochrome P450